MLTNEKFGYVCNVIIQTVEELYVNGSLCNATIDRIPSAFDFPFPVGANGMPRGLLGHLLPYQKKKQATNLLQSIADWCFRKGITWSADDLFTDTGMTYDNMMAAIILKKNNQSQDED